MSFKLTYILLLGIILCPSLNHVTWGLGWLRMCGKFRTAAWPSVTVFFWSVSMKSPMSAKKKWEVLSFSLLLSRGQRNHRVSQQPLALIFTHGTPWIVGQFGFWFIGADEHKAWRKPQCCCCTQAEHPRALHGPCVLGQELRGFSENDILMEVRLL